MMSRIVIDLIAGALEQYGPDITPARGTFHRSVINYGAVIVLFFYHYDKIRQVTYAV